MEILLLLEGLLKANASLSKSQIFLLFFLGYLTGNKFMLDSWLLEISNITNMVGCSFN